MADALFNKAKEQLLQAGINLSSDDIRVMLVKSTYVFDATDEFISDLGAVDNGRSAALTSKTFANGTFDAADTSLTATVAAACNACVVFKHTGSDASARLIAYIDFSAFTPAASQSVNVAFNASGIFAL